MKNATPASDSDPRLHGGFTSLRVALFVGSRLFVLLKHLAHDAAADPPAVLHNEFVGLGDNRVLGLGDRDHRLPQARRAAIRPAMNLIVSSSF